MSTKVLVEISPETTTRPVLTSVSQATRPNGSSARTASRTPSEIWSATLSGWPSVTDSDVKRYSLSAKEVMAMEGQLRGRFVPLTNQELALSAAEATSGLAAPALLALGEVDDQWDAVEPVALAQPVLDEVGVVARDAAAGVDLDRDARRPRADLRAVEQLEPVALLGRRLADLDHVAEEL